MASEFDKLAEAAGEFLLMEPLYLDPDQPTGLWFCDCPETCSAFSSTRSVSAQRRTGRTWASALTLSAGSSTW